MKKTIVLLFTTLLSLTAFAQEITGTWNGILKVQGTQLKIVFNISKTDTGFSSTMDSPEQKAIGIPITTTTFENNTLKLAVPMGSISYEGVLGNDGNIVGNFKQGALNIPLNLTKGIVEKEKIVRPQDPIKPYPYYSEDVTFVNSSAGITLAGTLTLPSKEGNFPVVVLISGSGPQNRDEELLGHKPFLVLSDYLTRNGIAVLRYDDRGIGESKGDFKSGTTADFATDASAAVAYLQTRKEINQKKIGLAGHSEGGTIAPIVANSNKAVAFIVLLAGTGLPGDTILLLQKALIERAEGVSEKEIQEGQAQNKGAFDIVKKAKTTEQLKTDLTIYYQNMPKDSNKTEAQKAAGEREIKEMISQLTNPWMQYFIKYDPATALEKVKCPVLAINGAKDLQVPPTENLAAIKTALAKAKNKKVTTKLIPNLNHVFQECTTGSPNEYADIQQTFSPTAMKAVLEWIQVQTK